nr:hypothetical protein [Microvirga pakistanensis]
MFRSEAPQRSLAIRGLQSPSEVKRTAGAAGTRQWFARRTLEAVTA